MARIARRYSSDHDDDSDELPDLNTLVKGSNSRTTTSVKPTFTTPAKSLVPKSSSVAKSTTRRVRKLGETNQVNDNPLFRKWTSDQIESPQTIQKLKPKTPRVRIRELRERTPKVIPPPQQNSDDEDEDEDEEDEDEDEEPRLRIRGSRRPRPQILEDSDEDDGEHDGSDDETLMKRIRRLQKAKTDKAAENNMPPSKPDDVAQVEEAGHAEIEPETEADHEESIADDPSVYHTAEEEESSDYSEDSTSDFELDDSPGRERGWLPTKPRFGQSQRSSKDMSPTKNPPRLHAGSRSSNGSDPVVGPRDANPLVKGVKQETKNLSPLDSQPKATAADLAETFSKLRLQMDEWSDGERTAKEDNAITPPTTPPRNSKPKGLISPSKHMKIPRTPHRPSTDTFWSQGFVDDWNDTHSPRKLVLPPVMKSPAKPKTGQKKSEKGQEKERKKAFDAKKNALAESFLRELDETITKGQIAQLSESTGGVKIVWSKTLNTTAGRANWKRETSRTKKSDGTVISTTYKHHAAIELAEKVIDDEDRLLNVMAHEFCHLANFMVTGMTTNPHGKEFKAWATKCSKAFADRGINVTTKHSFDIDYKFVWTCDDCGTDFKRHSRSIDPARHRCGACKGMLKQTKPVPRAGGGATKYQAFVKEQMKVVREENPGSPQKDVMRLIADKWAKQGGGKALPKDSDAVGKMVSQVVDLTLE